MESIYDTFGNVSPKNLICSWESKGQSRILTYAKFQVILKNLVSRLGKDPNNYSSHSFRRGGASLAFLSKVPSELIKFHGDWSSDCYMQYLDITKEQKLSVTGFMSEYVNHQH